MNLAEFIYNVEHDWNGHKQNEIKNLPLEQGIEICKDLEELTEGKYFFTCDVYTDGSYSIIQKNYWKRGEHSLGHQDRIILSVDVS